MCLDYQAFQEANVNKESVTNQSVLCTSRNKPCSITDIDQKVNEKASIITVTNCDNKDDGQSSLHENEDVVLDSVIQKHPADNLFLDSDLSSNDYTFSINEEIIEDEQKNGTCLTEGKIHRVNDAHVKYVQSQVEKIKIQTLSTVKPKAVTSECFLEKIVHSSGDFNSNWQSTAPNAGPLKFMDESSDGCTTSADKKILDLPCSFNSVYMNKQDEKADLEIYSKYDTNDFEKLVVKSFEADSSSELKSLPTESIKLETQDNKYRPPVVPCKLIDQQFSYQGIDCLKALKDETSEEPEERCARKLKQYSTPIHESFVGLASITDASGHLGDLTTVPLENECMDEILTSKEPNEYNEKESTVSSCNYRSLNMDKNIRIQLGKTENFDEENGSYQGTPAALHSSVLDECDEKCNQETSVALNPSILENCQFPVSDDKNGTNYPDISNSQNITKPKEESRVDAKVTNPFQTAPLDEKSDENYQEIENFLHSLVSQDEDRNDSKRILDSVYCKESANRDMYTPDFDSDSDNLLSVRSSCSSASGSFECLKDLEASVPVMAQKLLNKDEIEKNACKQWDSEKSEEDIVISERHLYSEEMENCRRMSPTFENPQENVNGVAASSDCFSFSVLQDCNLSGLYSMIPEETNRYNQQLEVDSHYLQSNLLSKDIEEHTCNLDNSTSRNLEGTRLAVAGDEEIPEDVVSLQDPDEDDEELSLQYIPLSLSLSDANENEEDLYHINNCDTEKSGELDDLNCFQYQNEERKEENTVFQDIDDKHSSLKSHDNVNSVEILNEQHCDPGDQMFSDIEPGSGVQDKEILPHSQHSNFKRSFLSEVEQPVSLLLLHKCKTEDTINKGSKFEDQDLEDWNVSSNKDIKNKSDTLLESQDAININSGTVHGQTSTPSHSIEELLTSADVHTVLNGKYIDVQDFSEYSVSKDTGQDWTLVTPSYGYVNYTGEYLESKTLRKRTRGSEDSSCNFEMFESEETIIKSLDEQVPGKNLYEVLDTPDILPFVHLEEDSNEHKSRYENLTTCDLTISPSKKLLDENLLQNHSEIDNKKFKHKVDKKEEEQISHQPSTILTSEEATKEVKYLQTDNTSVVSRCDISPTKVQYLTVDSSEKEYFLVDKSVKTKPKVVKDDKLNKFKYNELALKIDTINNAVVQPKEKEHKRPMVYLNKEEPITDKKKHYKVQNKFENLEFGYEPDDSEDDNIQYGAPVSQKKVRVNKTPVFLNEWFLVDESSDGGKLKSRKIQNILGEEQHSYEYSSSKGFDFLNEDGENVLKVRDKDQEKTTEALESKWPVETLPEYLPIVVMMNKILKESEEDPYFSPGEVEDGELPTLDYELKSACGSRSSLVDLTDKKNISDYDQNFTKQFTYWKPRESSSPLEEEIYPLDVVESEDYSIEVQIGNSDYSKEQTEVIKKPSPFLGQYECEEREDETCTSVPLKSENSTTEEQSNSFGFKKEYPENAGGSCSLFLHCQNLKPHDEYFIVNEHAEKEKTMENKACSLSPENEKQGKVVMVEEKTVSFDVEKQTTGEKACLLCAGDENQDKLDVIKEQVMSSNTEKQTVENKEEACSLSLDSDEQGKQLMGKEQTCSSNVDKKPVTAKEGARSSSLHNEKQDKFFTVGEKTCNSNNDIVCCSEKQDEHFMLKEQASIELTEDNIYYNDEKQDELFMVKKQTSDANDEKKQREGIVCHDSEK
ncbi:uncharacterized protein LOC143227334 [Tachypleus tridentatus]|uniref:uncharacterized protein LOC143227334 n=1 Tax=Tachypleus tridentatus TaxID=6853 RepID=UPI003FD0AC55